MIVPAQKFSALVADLQGIDGASRELGAHSQGEAILGAFIRHAGYCDGAVWLECASGEGLRLAAASPGIEPAATLSAAVPDEIVERTFDPESLEAAAAHLPGAHTLVPLRHHDRVIGLIALRREREEPLEGTIELLRAAASFVTALLTAKRMADEVREGNFQLKVRLWELESLYDIGLSIAATLDQDELSEQILIRTISLLNARRAALYLRKGERFVLHRSFGEVRGQFLEDEIQPEELEALKASRRPIRMSSGADCLFPGCLSLLALPIATATEMVGVLAVADREHRDGSVGPFDESDVRLVRQFATQAAIALENARLHRDALEKQAIERELELAATIQRDILPRAVPRVEGLGIEVLARPARQLGGDYYTFIDRDGGFSLCVADVSGKSLPAAILVSALHAALHLLFHEGRDLGEIATELNRHIHLWSSESKFITLILATIDREHGMIRFVNAGHNPAYVVGLDGEIEPLRSHGLPVGMMSDSRYSAQTRGLPPGALLVFYSDGITEAENAAGEEFGNERLEALLRAHGSDTVAAIRRAIESDLEGFVGEAPQHDDQTLVLVRV
ncbi:MAG TPA: SpoIIE family protein phosphatase [Thermoanaerobaculia bacterium]|nr:SpoIIE family protein phosphatase [Thermoanaerobaculia bacterium]